MIENNVFVDEADFEGNYEVPLNVIDQETPLVNEKEEFNEAKDEQNEKKMKDEDEISATSDNNINIVVEDVTHDKEAASHLNCFYEPHYEVPQNFLDK